MAHRLVIMEWRVVEASQLIKQRHASGQIALGPGNPQGALAIVPPGVPSRVAAGEDPWEDPVYDRKGWRLMAWSRSLYAKDGGPPGILPPSQHQRISLSGAAMMVRLEAPGLWGWFEKTVCSQGYTLRLIARPDGAGDIAAANEAGERLLAELRLDAAPVFGDKWVRQHLHTPARSPSG